MFIHNAVEKRCRYDTALAEFHWFNMLEQKRKHRQHVQGDNREHGK